MLVARIRHLFLYTEVDASNTQLCQAAVSLSMTLSPLLQSTQLNNECQTGHPREASLFSALSFSEKVALENQRIFCDSVCCLQKTDQDRAVQLNMIVLLIQIVRTMFAVSEFFIYCITIHMCLR